METQMKRTCAIPIAPLGCGREGRHSRRNVQEQETGLARLAWRVWRISTDYV